MEKKDRFSNVNKPNSAESMRTTEMLEENTMQDADSQNDEGHLPLKKRTFPESMVTTKKLPENTVKDLSCPNVDQPIIIVVNKKQHELVMAGEKLEAFGLGVIMTKSVEVAFKLIGGTILTNISCPTCNTNYPDASALSEHTCSKTSNSICPVNRKFPCPAPDCGKILSTALTLGKHIKTHEVDELTCIECGIRFESLQVKGPHQAWHRRVYTEKQTKDAYDELRTAYIELSTSNKKLQYENISLKLIASEKGKEHLVVLIPSGEEAKSFLSLVKDQHITSVPVVVMSSISDATEEKAYMDEGAAGVVREPLSTEDVASVVIPLYNS